MHRLVPHQRPDGDGDDGHQVDGDRTARRADPAGEGGHQRQRQARAQHAEGRDGQDRGQAVARLPEPRGCEREGEHRSGQLGPEHHRQRAVPTLEWHGQVQGDAVEHRGEQHQPGADGDVTAGVKRGQPDQHDAEEPGDQPDADAPGRQPTRHQRGHQGSPQRHATVDHPGQRGVDPLLGDGEQHEGDADPQQAEQDHPRQVGAVHRPTCTRDQGERCGSERDAHERHLGRGEVLQAHRDEEEGGPPDQRQRDQHPPVRSGERVQLLVGHGHDGAEPDRSTSHTTRPLLTGRWSVRLGRHL